MGKSSSHSRIIFKAYGISVLSFFCFRLLFLMVNIAQVPSAEAVSLIAQSFLMGFRFDTVIICYFLFVPAILWWLSSWTSCNWPARFAFVYVKCVFLVGFLICSIDIPYFVFHGVRLNKMIFDWFATSPLYVLKMVFSEPSFWLVGTLPLVLVSMFFLWAFAKFIEVPWLRSLHSQKTSFGQSWWLLPVLFLLVLGARGRLSAKSPIRPGTAFFSANTFVNLMSLNPVYTLLNSLKQKEGRPLVDAVFAQNYMKSHLGISLDGTLGRNVKFSEPHQKLNVVLVVMESMAAKKTGFLNGKGLTPNIDRLSRESVSFRNAYTVGIHTFNGLYSSLFGLPSTFNEHPMKVFPMPKVGGLASQLKRHGYSTSFFVICDAEFDNMAGFLTHNDFDRVISLPDYPKDQGVSSLGVPDHVMFDESIKRLRKMPQPFFATYLTGSDHGPYLVPKGIPFKPKSSDKKDRTTEYADWAIGKFLADARREPWFDNTLFVFVADHGSPIGSVYDISLEYHHTPLFFYSPKHLKPQSKDDLVSQLDIFPTIMGILRAPYFDESLGIDVMSRSRQMIPINSDNVLGAMDREFLYVYRKDDESLYRWPKSDVIDYKKQSPEVVRRLKEFTLNLFQAGRELARPDTANLN